MSGEIGRFKRYPAYKDSGVEWLGEIPRGWDVIPLKRVGQFVGGGTPSKDNSEFWKGDIPWVSPKDMKVETVFETEDHVTSEAVKKSATKLVPMGAVLVVVRSGILIHTIPVALAGQELTLNQDLKAIVASPGLVPGYLRYFVVGMQQQLLMEWKKEGATVESLEMDLIANTKTPIPDTKEQRAITAFLDRETAKIDGMVAKKERLIDLLQEKRSALITHAVTKGLNPKVSTKDSRVQWLEEIPAHWKVTKLKFAVSRIVDCPHETPTYSSAGEHFVIRTSDVNDGILDFTTSRRVDDVEFRSRVRRLALETDDVVYSREGERFGHAALLPPAVSACLGQRMMQFRTSSRWNPGFLMWQLNARSVYQQACLDTAGATSPHVNVGTIRNFWLAEPPLEEQAAIAAYVVLKTTSFDGLIREIERGIARVRELRTALISAAVTGKIDVREEVA